MHVFKQVDMFIPYINKNTIIPNFRYFPVDSAHSRGKETAENEGHRLDWFGVFRAKCTPNPANNKTLYLSSILFIYVLISVSIHIYKAFQQHSNLTI